MTIALADREVRNAIEEAVYVVLGGVREAAKRLDVSTQAVYQLLGAEVVKNRDTALKIEAATEKAGRKVPAAELMALVAWTGPMRHPDPERGQRDPKGRAPSGATGKLQSVPATADAHASTAQTPASQLRAKARRSRSRRGGSESSLTPRTILHGAVAVNH